MAKILECHSQGDTRFSPLFAKVEFGGVYDTIENHWQLAKRFGRDIPKTWQEAKGRQPTHLHVCGLDIGKEYSEQLYNLLWLLYFDNNPDLVAYAKTFDGYYDKFAGKSMINQASVIQE